MSSHLTVTGNLAQDSELRFTATGTAVLNFTVMENTRERNAEGKWVDGAPLIWRVRLWGVAAENAAPHLLKGSRVIVTGKVDQDTYETKQGYNIPQTIIVADEVGLSLKFGLDNN